MKKFLTRTTYQGRVFAALKAQRFMRALRAPAARPNFLLSDGRVLRTSDGKTFNVRSS